MENSLSPNIRHSMYSKSKKNLFLNLTTLSAVRSLKERSMHAMDEASTFRVISSVISTDNIDCFSKTQQILDKRRIRRRYKKSKFCQNICTLTNMSVIFFVIVLLNNVGYGHSAYSECKFPEHWWGSWFQSGVPDLISISRHNISEKGVCRQHFGDRYLIENRAEKCIRCLVISEKHSNVLQYKESWCAPVSKKLSLDICLEINGDAPLFSLFRANTSPIKCPFSGPYLFSYSKGNNECREPLSEMDECTDDKRRLLKFRACADVYGSESKVEELECVADWKDGAYKYLVAKLNHSLASSDEDKFRCFIIERNSGDNVESYTIGQSGDASCDGLFSPRDGVRTLRIRKTLPITPRCSFPTWLSLPRYWKTLDNRNHFDFGSGQLFTVFDDKKDVLRRSKCISADDISFAFGFNATRFVIHTTFGCQSGFACMHVYLREARIAELQMGKIVSHVSDACLPQNFDTNILPYTTITTFDDNTRECPLKGVFSIKSKLPDPYSYAPSRYHNYSGRLVSFLDSRFICQERALRLKANCEDSDQFQFTCSIDNRAKNFRCRGGWQEKNSQMFLVSFLEKFNYEYCINYNMITHEIKMIKHSHFCYRNREQFAHNYDPNIIQTLPYSSQQSLGGMAESSSSSSQNHPFGVQRTGRTFPVIDYGSSSSQFREEPVALTLINEGFCNGGSSSLGLSSIESTIMVAISLLSILVCQLELLIH